MLASPDFTGISCVAGTLSMAATRWKVLREKSPCGSRNLSSSAGKRALSTGSMSDALP